MFKRLIIVFVVIVGIVLGVLYFTTGYGNTDRTSTNINDADTQIEDRTIRLLALGDNIPHDSINQQAETADGYDYTQYFQPISKVLDTADTMFCNQEAPSAGESLGISGYPTFNAPTEFSRDLSKIGCDIINLANNHVADKGTAGVDATLTTWEQYKPKAIAGANKDQEGQNQVRYFNVDDVKFSFVAFTDLSNNTAIPQYSVNMFEENLVDTLVTEARKNSDFVIVSAHWGTESQEAINSSQQKWATMLAEKGADLIIGTGPHVLQTVDTIKVGERTTTIFYSLGNMLPSQLGIDQLTGGVAVIDINKQNKKIDTLSFVPTYMHYDWTEQQEASEDLLSRRNLRIYPLSEAQEYIAKTRFNTTADAQLTRIDSLLNKNTKVNIREVSDF